MHSITCTTITTSLSTGCDLLKSCHPDIMTCLSYGSHLKGCLSLCLRKTVNNSVISPKY